MKKNIILIFTLLSFLLSSSLVFAQDDDGVIDFYNVFSKEDVNKTRVGNSIYNWSIYMPNDAQIDKNPKGNYFNMVSNSYKSNISINTIPNSQGFNSLDEIIAFGQNLLTGYYGSSKLYSFKKGKDAKNQEYIEITNVYTDNFYIFVDEEESKGYFNLSRLYLSNNKKYNYIYRINISMDLSFYNEHQSLLYKIADSFEMNFDSNNPNIKDLADNVTNWRVHRNTSYGWEIELAPYWKSTDIYNFDYNSSTQVFAPLYSDEEISGKENTTDSSVTSSEITESPNTLDESLSVSIVTNSKYDFEKWVEDEKSSYSEYNPSLYKIVSVKDFSYKNGKAKIIEANIQRTANKLFIEKKLLVDINQTKYVVQLDVVKNKYDKNKQIYDRMLASFKTIDKKSKYLDQILSSNDVNIPEPYYTVKLKKYPFEIKLLKWWRGEQGYYDTYYYDFYAKYSFRTIMQDASNSEFLNLFDNNRILNINASLNMDSFDNIVKNYLQPILEGSEYKGNLMDLQINKFSNNYITLYRIETNYNIKKLQEISSGNPERDYDFRKLGNTIVYLMKYKNYYYVITASSPILYWTSDFKKEIEDAFKTVKLENIDFSKFKFNWTKENPEKYKKAYR